MTSGYGILSWQGQRNASAHRVAYTLRYGAIPSGLKVLHACDIRRCVRPSHLFLGTQSDNIFDAQLKDYLQLMTVDEKLAMYGDYLLTYRLQYWIHFDSFKH